MKPITLKNQGLEFTLLRIIGQGRQSICYEAENQNKSIFYVKILKKQTDENKKAFKKAYEINQNLVSRHAGNSTSAIFAYLEDETYGPFVVMPKYEGNTLGKTRFKSLHELFHTFLSLSKAINQIHSAEHLVLDLSLDNSYVLSGNGGMTGVYLHDFDNMLPMNAVRFADNIGTSISFAAPEVLLEEFPSVCQQTDYYALGAMLHTILFGYSPMADQPDPLRYRNTLEPYCAILKNSIQVQNALDAFWARCLAFSPKNRYQNFEELEAALIQLCGLTHASVLRTIRSNYQPYIPKHYVWQEKEFNLLKDHFLSKRDEFAMAIIHSPTSGTGKTSLAHAFAHSMHTAYDCIEFCTWNSDSGFNGVLKQIKVDNNDTAAAALSRNTQHCLIIIDNYDGEISQELPYWGSHHYIFTSKYRSDEFEPLINSGDCICVDVQCSETHSKAVFYQVYNSLSNGQPLSIDEETSCYKLMKQTNFHTYTCDIVARCAAESGMEGIGKIQQLFNDVVETRKDLKIGEKSKSATVKELIDELFSDQIKRAMQDPIQKEALYLLSYDGLFNHDLLCTLIGDNKKLRRVTGKRALAQLERRGLVRTEQGRFFGSHYEGVGVVVHPLVHDCLKRIFANDSSWSKKAHDYRAFYNLYSIYQDKVHTPELAEDAWPTGLFLNSCMNGSEEWPQHIDLIKEVTTSLSLFDSPLERVAKHALGDTYAICSATDGKETNYFLWIEKTKTVLPLLHLQSCYPTESVAPELTLQKIRQMEGLVSIQYIEYHQSQLDVATLTEAVDMWVFEILKANTRAFSGPILNISEGIRRIGMDAFLGASTVNRLCLPKSLEIIDQFAFMGSGLEASIIIPKNVELIHLCAFSHCKKVKEVTFSGNTYVHHLAFENCIELCRINIKSIGVCISDAAFSGCIKLTEVNAPKAWLIENISLLASLPGYHANDDKIDELINKYRQESYNLHQ